MTYKETDGLLKEFGITAVSSGAYGNGFLAGLLAAKNFYMKKEVPCSIDEGKTCNMPFCRMINYTRLAERAKEEWLQELREAIKVKQP